MWPKHVLVPSLALFAVSARSASGFAASLPRLPRGARRRAPAMGRAADGTDATRRPLPSSLSSSSSLCGTRGGGGPERGFTCEDNLDRAVITLPIGEDVSSRDVTYSLDKSVLTLGVKGAAPAIDREELWGPVIADDCVDEGRARARHETVGARATVRATDAIGWLQRQI